MQLDKAWDMRESGELICLTLSSHTAGDSDNASTRHVWTNSWQQTRVMSHVQQIPWTCRAIHKMFKWTLTSTEIQCIPKPTWHDISLQPKCQCQARREMHPAKQLATQWLPPSDRDSLCCPFLLHMWVCFDQPHAFPSAWEGSFVITKKVYIQCLLELWSIFFLNKMAILSENKKWSFAKLSPAGSRSQFLSMEYLVVRFWKANTHENTRTFPSFALTSWPFGQSCLPRFTVVPNFSGGMFFLRRVSWSLADLSRLFRQNILVFLLLFPEIMTWYDLHCSRHCMAKQQQQRCTVYSTRTKHDITICFMIYLVCS